VQAPDLTAEALLDGSWMLQKERQLREDSPVVWWLRSTWNELRYRAGVSDNRMVWVGANEWFFIMEEMFPDRAAFDRVTTQRRQMLRDVRDLVKRAGAELFVMIVPDKARVYPELAYGPGGMPPGKAGNYAAILADLADAGIPTVDLAAPMAAVRASEPERELYYHRDTHWKPQGALAAAMVVAGAIEARFGALLSPRRAMDLGNMMTWRLVGDLPASLGIATIERPDPVTGELRTFPMSFLSEHLAELYEYYGVEERIGNRTVPMWGDDPDAEILLIGTSFSKENGANALSLCLGRPLRKIIKVGAEGILPLESALPELQQGTRAKVVVWELVERGMFVGRWLAPKL
jgi:hypothetical protein